MTRSHLALVVCGFVSLAAVATCKSSGEGGANPGAGGDSAGSGGQGGAALGSGGDAGDPGAGGTAMAGAGGAAGSPDAGAEAGVPIGCPAPPKMKLTLLTKTIIPTAWTSTGWKAAPLAVTQAKGDDRIFVAQRGGRILIYQNGALNPDPFLDMSASVAGVLYANRGERGLLNLALHPDYAQNGRFFVYYTGGRNDPYSDALEGDIVVAEGKRSATNPDKADVTLKPLLIAEHSEDAPQNYDDGHNGGLLAFGNDGFLWTATGDGGNGYDYFGSGQDPNHPLAKLYRLDVDNPLADPHKGLEAVWAMGQRNPFRGSFDPDTGDLYIGDIHEGHWEEINWQPFGTPKGLNYGWGSLMKGATQMAPWVKAGMEGSHCFPSYIKECEKYGVMPLYEYEHMPTGEMTMPRNFPETATTITLRTAVIAGFVYRGAQIPGMKGRFIFGDHGTGVIKSFVNRAGTVDCLEDHTADLVNAQTPVRELVGFGRDAAGELFLFDMDMQGSARNASIYRIEAE